MSLPSLDLWALAKRALFRVDAETAHRLMVDAVRGLNDAAPFLLERISGVQSLPSPTFCPEVWGMRFRSGLGLAAGFDKNAEMVSALPRLGFGFCEIGTVTPLPQSGNPRPRLLREGESLFNRMGFNNDGALAIAKNLERHRKFLPTDFRVGVNIGKNKDTSGADIARDYAKAAEPFLDLADFFVINVSSPNTPGLRALQEREGLEPILDAVLNLVRGGIRQVPVLVKLAPEVSIEHLGLLIDFFAQKAVSGLVLTNTLAGESLIGTGGWSGERVRRHAQATLIAAREFTKIPVISVGGIDSLQVAKERIAQGASLVEIYSSWIFKGPRLPGQISSGF